MTKEKTSHGEEGKENKYKRTRMEVPPNSLQREEVNNNDLGRRSPWWGGGRKEPLTSNHLQSKEEERRRQRRCGSPGYSYPQGDSP